MNAPPETAATFAGIVNENEFFSHHYLAEVFRGDIQDTLSRWQAAEDAHPGEEAHRAPFDRLRALARDWFAARERIGRERGEGQRLALERALLGRLFAALGYALQPIGLPLGEATLPALGAFGQPGEPPRLLVLHAWDVTLDGEEALTLQPHKLLWDGAAIPPTLHGLTWQEVLSDRVFGADHPPRWVVLAGSTQTLLIDRAKWPQNRLLRFDWNEILGRREDPTLKAAAALLGRDSLLPDEGEALLDALDENAHKHAFAVSEDLKYALREAIELLGNEAARQLVALAREQKKGIFSGERELEAGPLTLECLRLMYRLLFLFYIEARPELGYVPIRNSEAYQKGYSLEMLRDLELVPLVGEEARNGLFFDHSIRRLFRLIHEGHAGSPQARLDDAIHHSFRIAALDAHLFDPASTPLLDRVRFPNAVWQQVIQLMSLSREGNRRRRGRVSYAQLGINQLGAVYEALLSYRGFFAKTDLYEVKPAGESPDALDAAHFVPPEALAQYREDERVYDRDEAGHRKLRLYPKGSFIYRLAGRDREKSASFYTPEVLTRCLVKYALKELLKDRSADAILQLDDLRAGDGQRGVPERGGQPVGRGVSGAQAGGAGPAHPSRPVHPGVAADQDVHRRPQRVRGGPEPGGGGTGGGVAVAERHFRFQPCAVVRLPVVLRQFAGGRPAAGGAAGLARAARRSALVRAGAAPGASRPAGPTGRGGLSLPAARSGHGRLWRQGGQGPLSGGVPAAEDVAQGVLPAAERG